MGAGRGFGRDPTPVLSQQGQRQTEGRHPPKLTMPRTGNGLQEREKLLTVEELAGLLQVQPGWIYSHTRKRSSDPIPGFRLGKYWRFRESDVLDWLERQRVGPR